MSTAQVLVVDDDLGTRETYGAALGRAGYAVNLADCGAAAITHLSSAGCPHGILLDYRLGDMTGCDVLRWMRREGRMAPTAVLTAFPADFDPDEAISLGALAYSEQPLDIATLIALTGTLVAPPSQTDDPTHLHARVLAGDPGALECLDAMFLAVLPPRLARAFPRAPHDLVQDAVVDAALEYGAAPQRFDPSRAPSIADFVSVIATRNLRDCLAAEASRHARERRWVTEHNRLRSGIRHPRHEPDLWGALVSVITEPSERRAAQRWMNGEADSLIAQELGCGHRALDEQSREVKRFKDRILKRLSRQVRDGLFHG
jgi:CheY-like chemotaxis protein